MGVMTKMRESTGAVIGVLVFAFGGLWVLQDSGVFDVIGRGGAAGGNIAIVDGEPITAELFNNAVNQQLEYYQQQGQEVTPALRAQIENQVFEALVDNAIREGEMERLGIEVTDEEVFALITGPTPDPIIAQYFPDGAGGVDRNLLNQVVSDPEYAQDLNALEEQVRRNRREAKLAALIGASARVTDAEVANEHARRGRTAAAQIVALRYADVSDDAVEVTEADIEAYYDANRSDYEQEKTYFVEFVGFPKSPSAEDSTRALDELTAVKAGLVDAEDPVAYARTQSFGAPAEAEFVPASDMPPALATAVYSDVTEGRVVGPVVAGEEAVLVKIVGSQPAEGGETIRARHILLPAGQEERARDLKAQLASGGITFAAAARQFSTDESNRAQGGDLGYFGRGRMVGAFEEAAFAAPVGQTIGPVETQFGLHLIRVEGRATQEAEIVRIARPVRGDFDRIRERAEDFQVFTVEEGRDFNEAAQEAGLATTQVSVTEDNPVVPGLQVGRPLVRWLRTARPGDLSEPFDAGEQFAVVKLVEVQDEGVQALDDVRDQVESQVMLEKKKEVQVAKLREALAGATSMETIAAQAGTSVETVTGLSMNSPVIQGFGREPRAVGAVFGVTTSQRSGVVAGENAAFVVRPTTFTEPTPLTDEGRETLREQMLTAKRQRLLRQWTETLREKADIQDFRNDLL